MAKKAVTELTEKNFPEFIKPSKEKLIVVDFFATWCGPCHMMAPVLDTLAEKLQGKVKFGKIDVDEAPKLSQEYEISSIPCLILFQDGEAVDRIIGALPQESIQDKINDYL